MICHRTSDFRVYDAHIGAGRKNARVKPPESLMLSTHPNSQYDGLYGSATLLNLRPIDGAGVVYETQDERCECGWPMTGAKCTRCGAE